MIVVTITVSIFNYKVVNLQSPILRKGIGVQLKPHIIYTVAHVIGDAPSAFVRYNHKTYLAKVIHIDAEEDTAILYCPKKIHISFKDLLSHTFMSRAPTIITPRRNIKIKKIGDIYYGANIFAGHSGSPLYEDRQYIGMVSGEDSGKLSIVTL